MIKLIAMYLPQFHNVPENDEWWGKGYTEWTAVKRAEPIYKNHMQPREPLDDNYYDLLKKETMQWQAGLMHKYGIYGMCFYHYYFGEGRKMLEKPAENLLAWKDIDMPFCFSWANETWARSWSKLTRKNTWNVNIEAEYNDSEEVLIKQNYGGEKEWRIHLEYLIPFFMDNRYIKIESKPLFLIHEPTDIPQLGLMKQLWNEWIKEYGFDGVYFMGRNASAEGLDAIIQQEPNYSDMFMIQKNKTYDDLSKQIIANAYLEINSYLCATPGYDDTPRRGIGGEIIEGSTPEKFYQQLKALMLLAQKRGQEYVFINAWNEWGEGMYLEPDKLYGYGYLEAIQNAICNPKYSNAEFGSVIKVAEEGIKDLAIAQRDKYFKMKKIYSVVEQMLYQKEQGQTISLELRRRGYKSVAIFGMGIIGKHVINDLKYNSFPIDFVIDNNVMKKGNMFPIYKITDDLPHTDAVILTVEDGQIEKQLIAKIHCPIIRLSEMI